MNHPNSMIMNLRGGISKSRNMWVMTISLHSRRCCTFRLQKLKAHHRLFSRSKRLSHWIGKITLFFCYLFQRYENLFQICWWLLLSILHIYWLDFIFINLYSGVGRIVVKRLNCITENELRAKTKFCRDSITCWYENPFVPQIPYLITRSINVFHDRFIKGTN